jgi:hypothetical protein
MVQNNIVSPFLIFCMLLLVPFLQMGYSYYSSVSFFGLIAFFFISFNSGINSSRVLFYSVFSFFFFLIKIIHVSISTEDIRNSLIPFREAFCFIGFVFLTNKISEINFNLEKIAKLVKILLLSILVMVLIQMFYLSNGQYFGFPVKYFAMNKETLESADLALSSGSKYRPTAFYGEPSYAGWIVLSLMAILLQITDKLNGYIYIIVSLFIVILLESFSGILSIGIYTVFWLLTNNKKSIDLGINLSKTLTISFISFLLLFFLSTSFQKRVTNLIAFEDSSFVFRLINPYRYMVKMINNNNFLGVNNFSELLIDNAAWALLLQYGILAIFILYLLLKYSSSSILTTIYIILALNFNGTFLSFDKIIISSLVIGFLKLTNVNYQPESYFKR